MVTTKLARRPVKPGDSPRVLRKLPRFDKTSLRHALIGVLVGCLAGLLIADLGPEEVSPWTSRLIVLAFTLAGGLFALAGLLWIPVAVDVLLLVVYFIVSSTPLMFHLAGRWVRSDSLPASAEAIIVLSANVNSDGMLNTHGVQRLLTGIELYQRGIAPRVFTTEVKAEYGDVIRSSVGDQRRLLQMGRAVGAWTSLTGTHTTHDEALKSVEQLPGAGHRVIVVTSPLHTRRACAAFERVGFHVSCAPSREQQYVTWHPVNPKDRLAAFREYTYERLGMIKYRIHGWLPQGR